MVAVPVFRRVAAELKLGETPRLAPGAIEQLITCSWPGNVRELENLVERAMILHRSGPLRFDDLAAPGRAEPAPAASPPDNGVLDLDAVTARHIRRVLDLAGGKIHGPGGAGELLGVNPNTLRSRMRRLGIPFRGRRANRS
ncbi:MAG: hypothetical protein PVG53_05820 [Holophagae bacterium]|jgi:transcriptional regulator with GAF, ATPase, and Fis domain